MVWVNLTASYSMMVLQYFLLAVPILVVGWYIYTGRKAPPGPRGWPIIGVAGSLTGNLHCTLTKWARQHGPLMSIRLGPKMAYVVSDGATAYQALVKNGDVFADRLPSTAGRHLNPVGVLGSLLVGNGQSWKEFRRFFLSAFRRLGVGKASLEPKIKEEVAVLLDQISGQGEVAFDPAPLINKAVTNIICCIALGKRFEYSDPKFAALLALFRKSIENFSFFRLATLLPILFYTPIYGGIRKRMATVRAFFQTIIKEHQLTYDPQNERDVIDMYLTEIVKSKSECFSERNLSSSIADLFAAGSDTSSNTINWSLLLLSKYPHVQEKVQQEIDDVIGHGRTPSMDDKSRMPYTSATIMEVMRFRAVIPVVYRNTTQQTTLSGFTLPKGSQVFINIWAIMQDPNVFENPQQFEPERFLTDESKDMKEAFIPFGEGRRVCLGENLARIELFLLFTSLFQRFRFSAPDDDPDSLGLDGGIGLTHKPVPYKIHAKLR